MPQTKWEEEFYDKFGTAIGWIELNNQKEIMAGISMYDFGNHIKQFISSLRKSDEEALIKMLPYKKDYHYPKSQEQYEKSLTHNNALHDMKQLIKDYYKSN